VGPVVDLGPRVAVWELGALGLYANATEMASRGGRRGDSAAAPRARATARLTGGTRMRTGACTAVTPPRVGDDESASRVRGWGRTAVGAVSLDPAVETHRESEIGAQPLAL
jgi:hypothetical protein